MIGRRLGRFIIRDELGQGGMATVWRAHDELLGRPVALKVLDEKLAGSPKLVRRFVHEARTSAHLDHPGIVAVYDAGEADGTAYIALALIDGETVTQRVSGRLLPIPEAVRIIVQAAEALAYAHSRHVIHRDVTGRNIMVGRDGRVFVLDFGLSRAAWESRLTTSEAPMGTAAYMAPERIRGAEADERTDVYGLGVVLFEALTGTFPYVGERSHTLLFKALNVPPVSPRDLRPEISTELERIVLKAIAREPEGRYASVTELAKALEGAVLESAPDPCGARAPGRVPPLPDPSSGPAPRDSREFTLPTPLYLAVLPFEAGPSADDTEGACRTLAARLGETLTSALSGAEGLSVLRPSEAQVAEGHSNPRSLARMIGANALLSGRVDRSGSQLRVTYSVLDPWRAVNVAGGVVDGSAFHPFELEDQLVKDLRRALGVAAPAQGPRPAREHDPAAADHYAQALAYLRRYDNEASIDAAIRLFEQLITSEGDQPLYLAGLARACLLKHQHTQQRQWESRAAAACERAVALEPEAAEVLVALGALRFAWGQHDAAIDAFERALARNPAAIEARLGAARSHFEAGRTDAAESAVLAAIAGHPRDWRAYSMLGMFCLRLGRYAKAVEAFQKVVELVPDSARGMRDLGSALYRLDRFEEAALAYEESIALLPSDQAYSNLGTAYYFMGRPDDALAAFRRAADLSPSDPIRLGNLGNACHWIPGHEKEAGVALDRAIALMRERLDRDPARSEWWARMAGWLANRGNRAEALEAVTRATALAPNDVHVMGIAGRVYFQLGERSESLRWFRRAIEAGHPPGEFIRSRELAPLRDDPEFRRLLAMHPAGNGPERSA